MSTTGEIFLTHSITKLKQMSGYTGGCLEKLTPDQIWHRGGDTQNSIGNLVLHLCGNIRQWIGSSIGGMPDVRQRDREFAADSRIGTSELLSIFQMAVGYGIAILETLPPDRLTERVATQDGDRFVLEVIYQVVGHFQQHAGQIMFATKLLTGADLNFYKKSS